HPGDRSESHEHRRRARDEQPVERAPPVGRARTARVLARHPRRYVRRIHAVAVAFPGPRLLPTPVLPTGRGVERDRARTSGHQERPANHSPVERWAAASQLAEHRDPPDEPPQLVGGSPALYWRVIGGSLLMAAGAG